MPHHERFDSAKWEKEFSLERVVQDELDWMATRQRDAAHSPTEKEERAKAIERALRPEPIIGPRHVITLERLRREYRDKGLLGRSVETDVCVWGLGEPKVGSWTKFGGVPYRPADREWPLGDNNEPSLFLGQICFVDSLDVLRAGGVKSALPGDVLLIFDPSREMELTNWFDDPNSLQFEWWPLGMSRPFEQGQVPDQHYGPHREIIAPTYAELHRTMDYPDVGENDPPRTDRGMGDELVITHGTKIGGVNRPLIEFDELPGVFLAQMESILTTHMRYPFLNTPTREESSTRLNASAGSAPLMIGDMGGLYLFVQQTGLFRKRTEIRWICTSG